MKAPLEAQQTCQTSGLKIPGCQAGEGEEVLETARGSVNL